MSSIQPTNIELAGKLRRAMHDHWGMFLAEGIVLVVLGVAAITLPVMAGVATTVLLGWLFAIAGIVGLIASFRTRSAPGFWWSLFSAVLSLLVAMTLLAQPLQGLVTLTWLMVVFFIFEGVSVIFMAIAHRNELSGKWQWMLVNGIVTLVLAAFVIAGLPGSLVWALGLLVGIDMLFGGASLIAIALAARSDAAP